MTNFRRSLALPRLGLSAVIVMLLPQWLSAQSFSLQQITDGLTRPVGITNALDSRLFIIEQTGHIRIYDGTKLLPADFLDISSLVLYDGGERGLLGLAFHPNYATNGYFYVNYTRQPDGATVVARYSVSLTDPNVADTDPNSSATLLVIPQPFSNHNGGQLQFGPDGYLYIGMGDGGSGGDPLGNGQNLGTLLGKLLRIDVDNGSPYGIPADNPFLATTGAKPEIWAYGFRNPWRFSFDRQTGDLFIGDVGQGCWEEIDFQPANSEGGQNYGWNTMEGDKCYIPALGCFPPPVCPIDALTQPILTYGHSDPGEDNCAVTGGYRYRGTQVPQLSGTYVYADYCSGRIWGATPNGSGWATSEILNTDANISTFGEDWNGELYFADLFAGTIYRIGCPASGLPFSDDFASGDISTWSQTKGTWNVVNGTLTSTTTQEAEILAPVSGCSPLTIEADLQAVTAGTRVSLLGWRQDDSHYVELILMQDKRQWLLQQVWKGKVVAKKSFKHKQLLQAGVNHHAKVTYDGKQFQVFIDGGLTPVITLKSKASFSGSAGFRVKLGKTTSAIVAITDIQVY